LRDFYYSAIFVVRMTFEELNLAPALVRAVRDQGYETPTPIQAQAIPAVIAGHDVLAGAQTGTGKTAAFVLPMLHHLSQNSTPSSGRQSHKPIRALVLTPTRELAAQVEESVQTYGQHLSLQSGVVFGGVGMNPQIKQLQKGVDILVATPGRLLDLAQQGFLDLSKVEILVLDEADRMLDMGFIHDVKKILALVPAQKQSLLFSATFSDEIRELANTLLRKPLHIQVTPRNTTVQRISQVIHPVGRNKKKDVLAHIIQTHEWSQVLVFTRTKFGANSVADFLNHKDITAMALHGNKSQAARTQALAGFKSGEIRVLVATDIAARGIDIDDLPHVVNYEIPNVSEDYVHRIGRTGRAGANGEAINLVCMDEEGFMQEIERFTKQRIEVKFLEGFGPEPGEKAEPIAMGRQTIWGGAGKPPSRDVMAAAAKAARSEMMDRIREKKTTSSDARHRPSKPKSRSQMGASELENRAVSAITTSAAPPKAKAPYAGDGKPRHANKPPRRGAPAPSTGRTEGFGKAESHASDAQPGPSAFRNADARNEKRANPRSTEPRNPNGNVAGGRQPDPLRTSIDAIADRGGYRGGNRNSNGGAGKPRSNTANPSRGGPADPLRTSFGRLTHK
jgi:ATP-dependent RNA helicase RhlE